jgi:fused signal recognition particle receptor
MFGFLKKKLEGFSEKLKKTIEKKAPAEKTDSQEQKKVEKVSEETPVTAEEKKETPPQKQITSTEEKPVQKKEKKETIETKTKKEETAEEMEKELFEEIEAEIEEEDKKNVETIATTKIREEKHAHGRRARIEEKKQGEQAPREAGSIPAGGEEIGEVELEEAVEEEKKEESEEDSAEKIEEAFEEEKETETAKEEAKKALEKVRQAEIAEKQEKKFEIKKVEEDKRELKAKVGVKGNIFGRLLGGVQIKESEISNLLWELELSLIESDVEQDAAREIVSKIKEKLLGQKVPIKNLDEFLKKQIKEILAEMMKTAEIDLIQRIKERKREGKPYKILMLGPNGAGKTTTIAKLAHHFQKNGLTSIVAAGDTFRAAAIDQLGVHAEKLGIRMVKHQYGGDPTAVAFDAVKAAEAGKIDVVMIDSAGRQETNKNLMEELKKMGRVISPDFKIYVGEAYTGQGLLEQAKEFDEAAGIDGFILTKIDTDAKGGTTISLL